MFFNTEDVQYGPLRNFEANGKGCDALHADVTDCGNTTRSIGRPKGSATKTTRSCFLGDR